MNSTSDAGAACTTPPSNLTTPLMAPGRHAALAATPLNRGDFARASQAKPKCSAIIGHRTACTVPPISLTTQFQLSRQQIDDQVQAPQQSSSHLQLLNRATANSMPPISLTTPSDYILAAP